MSERRRRGLDAILDSGHIDLEPTTPEDHPDEPSRPRPGGDRQRERGEAREGRPERRRVGRPRSSRPPERELMQRGFYLELRHDQMIDEMKSSLKRHRFTPDRSAILRAAIEAFGELDEDEQERRVRDAK